MQWIRDSNTSHTPDGNTPYSQPVPGRSSGPNSDVYIGSEASNQHFGVNGFCTNGKLFWGHNIGWASDEPRKILPIANSLHPLSHYSRSFLAGRVYKGSTGLNQETFNLPRHAVSFLGTTQGIFVNKPPKTERHLGDLK